MYLFILRYWATTLQKLVLALWDWGFGLRISQQTYDCQLRTLSPRPLIQSGRLGFKGCSGLGVRLLGVRLSRMREGA